LSEEHTAKKFCQFLKNLQKIRPPFLPAAEIFMGPFCGRNFGQLATLLRVELFMASSSCFSGSGRLFPLPKAFEESRRPHHVLLDKVKKKWEGVIRTLA
jgi:hypothetical protein